MRLNLKEIWLILDSKEKRQMISVTILQAFSGLFDVFGILSIMPFLTLAANPEILSTNKYLSLIQAWTNFNNQELIIFFGLFSFFIIIINQSVRIFSTWYANVVNQSIWRILTKRMFGYYLGQQYSYHLQNNSYVMLEKLSVQVNAAQSGGILPLHDLLGFLFSSFFILGTLLFLHPVIILISVLFFGVIYIFLFQVYKKEFEKLGKFLVDTSSRIYKLYGDSFGSIKEIKILHNENYYKTLFDPIAIKHSDALIKSRLFTDLPYGIAEIIGFGGLLFLTLVLLSTSTDFKSIVPTLGLFAFALKRIIPSINGIYRQISTMKLYQPAFNAVKNELAVAFIIDNEKNKKKISNKKIEFNKMIELNNLTFSYENSKLKALDSISFKIKKGIFLGITGSTGSGKTTLLDIILGLHTLKSGKIFIDGELLNKDNLLSWHSNIGYVSQEGFISDNTIASNIAFGTESKKINLLKVKQSAELAMINEFIENELTNKYDTIVGERGVRLSGGQRQRLRIARAFYREPKILILDEATSALDVLTEEKIIHSLQSLSIGLTVILVSHRITVLKHCDKIILVEDKKIAGEGKYEYLEKNNMKFRELIEKQKDNISQ